jgi:hypothetical protein
VLTEISQGRALLRNTVSGEPVEEFFDVVVACRSPKPQNALYAVCRKHAPTKLVGDAVAPRNAMLAFREGDRAGRTV